MAKRRRPRSGKIYLCYKQAPVGDKLYVELATPKFESDGSWTWECGDGNEAGGNYFDFWECIPHQKHRHIVYG